MRLVTIYLAHENVIVVVVKYDENLSLMETNEL